LNATGCTGMVVWSTTKTCTRCAYDRNLFLCYKTQRWR
jgi:hypothetical protein